MGRTPEYLSKKIEPYEMKMAVFACLATPVTILVGSGIAALLPGMADQVSATGAHGFQSYSTCLLLWEEITAPPWVEFCQTPCS